MTMINHEIIDTAAYLIVAIRLHVANIPKERMCIVFHAIQPQ